MKSNKDKLMQLPRKVSIITEKTVFTVKEAYKSARTNIMLLTHGEGCKKIILTSAFPKEGKTTTCVNIAITFAQTGAKVLLLDADLRKPRMQKIFSVQKNIGLTNVLSGINDLSESLTKTVYENLDLLTSGPVPPNPVELLASCEMEKLLDVLSKEYDYIFIDSPPVNVVTDAIVLSRLVSGVFVVVRSGITDHISLKEAVAKLEFAKSKPLGFILNDINQHSVVYKYKSKYKYSKYSYNKYE